MKLTTYSVFSERLRALPEVVSVGNQITVYRLHEGKWWSEANQEIVDAQLTKSLLQTQREINKYYRPRKKKTCFFWLDALTSVVAIECNFLLRANRLNKIEKALTTCYSNAKNEFDATHDALTLLPNRKSFEETLETCITDFARNPAASSSPIVGLSTDLLTLLAFDLDHFKQINDTFGHPYGDVVLAAFAWRLETFAEEIEKQRKLKTYVARLGGEEFQLLVIGLSDEKDGLQIANDFRQKVKNSALPSDEEWIKISARRGISDDRLPSPSERTLSVSIGHALLTSAEAQLLVTRLGSTIRVTNTLIQQADVALYRAKTDGRDCARAFREIKDRLGRVLEHHAETGIVTIDIGTEVGVKSGMEFLVYHPQFYGNHPFYQSDGRTKKKLGTYPKYPSGRLTVFEASGEISFAQVIENKQQTVFTVGSRLEYVPLGSFTHLVTSPLERSQANLANYDQIIKYIEELIKEKRRIVTVSIAIQDMESMVIARGTAYGNDILASVFRSIRASFAGKTVIAMTSATEFVVVTDCYSDVNEERVHDDVKALTEQFSQNAKCAAGIYDSKKIEINEKNPEMAIECARMARSLKDPVSTFDANSAGIVIQNWRSRQAWEEGIADYKRLKSFGISSPGMENAAGLCYLERQPEKSDQDAIQCFSAAIASAKGDKSYAHLIPLYELNLAHAFSVNGDHEAAIEIFSKYPTHRVDDQWVMPEVYLVSYARSIYYLSKASQLTLPAERTVSVLTDAIETGREKWSEEWKAEFQKIIQSIQTFEESRNEKHN